MGQVFGSLTSGNVHRLDLGELELSKLFPRTTYSTLFGTWILLTSLTTICLPQGLFVFFFFFLLIWSRPDVSSKGIQPLLFYRPSICGQKEYLTALTFVCPTPLLHTLISHTDLISLLPNLGLIFITLCNATHYLLVGLLALWYQLSYNPPLRNTLKYAQCSSLGLEGIAFIFVKHRA